MAIFRIHGPFLFGGTDKLHEIGDQADTLPPVVVLQLRNMTAIDATGLSAIEELADELKAKGHTLVLCGAPSQPMAVMRKAECHARQRLCWGQVKKIEQHLRSLDPPVIARIQNDRVVLDLRTVLPLEDAQLASARPTEKVGPTGRTSADHGEDHARKRGGPAGPPLITRLPDF